MTTAQPIFVTGLPRSGTSLVAGILSICGAWTGDSYGSDAYNRKGYFENKGLREGFLKPYLSLVPADPLGLETLPPLNQPPLLAAADWRDRVLAEIGRQGYVSGAWVYKDAKLVLTWRQWAEAFPEARWVVVRRAVDDVIASCLRAEPMTRRIGYDYGRWLDWAERYAGHLKSIKAAALTEIWPDANILNTPKGIRPLIVKLGLTWRPELVADFVDVRLWHGSLRAPPPTRSIRADILPKTTGVLHSLGGNDVVRR